MASVQPEMASRADRSDIYLKKQLAAEEDLNKRPRPIQVFTTCRPPTQPSNGHKYLIVGRVLPKED